MPFINSISYYFPETILSNETLSESFPEWPVDKISSKTGIVGRHIAAPNEFASDMAISAAQRLFSEYNIAPDNIDFILLCTQSPDFFLPTTACIVQEKLGIPTTSGALDFNLGCSGYVYGLSLAKGLLNTGDIKNVLLLTSDTYSKFINPEDKSVRTIFGDAASATLVSLENTHISGKVGRFSFGTDGKGADNLIVRDGVTRRNRNINPLEQITPDQIPPPHLYMNGPEIFSFTLKRIPEIIAKTLSKNNLTMEDIDLFIFHQANKYMLEHLQNKLNISDSKFFIHLENCGNTVSSTIPIALKEAILQNKITPGMKIVLCGFGVGYSWGATVVQF